MTILAGSTLFAISPRTLAVPRGEYGLQLTEQGLRQHHLTESAGGLVM
jgi:hypothetical protein